MSNIQSLSKLIEHITDKEVLFITTKNLSYIRNTQEINLLNCHARNCTVIGSSHKSYLIRLINVYFKLLFTSLKDCNMIWVGFAPQLILPLFHHKLCKPDVTLIEDFFISMFDTLCNDRKTFAPSGLIGKLLHYIDKITLSYGDHIVCDTKAHSEYFHTEFDAPYKKLCVLYLQADTKIYFPMQLQRPPHLRDKYIVLYFGSVLPLQGCDIVLQAMKNLADKKSLYFYFIGPINTKQYKEQIPLSDNIEYINWLPQEELAKYINYADLCLAGHFNTSIEKAKRTIPGKAYIYQAIKKPMILGDNPANHELFNNDPNAVFVEMGNAAALANTILKLSSTT